VQLVSLGSTISDIQNAGDGFGRLFLVQQAGIIRIFRDGALLARPFLDIGSLTRGEGERGLLGLAFPPGFAEKQRFFINYTDVNGNTVIAQYRVSADANVADSSSETILMTINQPFANHNGGQLRFGPDGYLYIGMGDGGSGGDPRNNAQTLSTLLGKMLRVDVESNPGQLNIPPGNPFVNTPGARPEIWAYGLRNPWRFSFDRATGDLWIGDVGQNSYEEIDFQPASSGGGENYGWNIMEGAHCFRDGCNTSGLVLPVAEYQNSADGCSVSGGFVYRGDDWPGLRGIYLYGDYCSGRIWGIERQGTGWNNRLLLDSPFSITTFGEDESGELYLGTAGGDLRRIESSRAPRFSASGVVNAASFAPGLIPGSLATIFVAGVLDEEGILSADRIPLPSTLAEVTVTIESIAAPLHVVANRNGQEQVNFQVPFEIAGRQEASVVVARAGASSAPVSVPVMPLMPAIYTAGGTSAVVVHNSDYSLVTAERPLQRGEDAFLYAAGLGPVTNQPVTGDGAPATALASATAEVQVTLGGVPCTVQFAGLAPGLVGVYQVNFQVHQSVPGGVQELVLTAGSETSPAVSVPVE
jgi:uncharacterized protein (TIGR03437 family)